MIPLTSATGSMATPLPSPWVPERMYKYTQYVHFPEVWMLVWCGHAIVFPVTKQSSSFLAPRYAGCWRQPRSLLRGECDVQNAEHEQPACNIYTGLG